MVLARSLQVPKIRPLNNGGSIRIQFVINKVKYNANPIYRGCYYNPSDLVKAEKIAAQIRCDIANRQFDYSDTKLTKYCEAIPVSEIPVIPIPVSAYTKPSDLLDLWEQFEERQKNRVAQTTIKKDYKEVRRALNKLTSEQLKFDNLYSLTDTLLEYYKLTTLEKLFAHLKACGNWGVRNKLITENPFIELHSQLPKKRLKTQKPECFTLEEMKEIIVAFRTKCNGKKKVANHQFYADFVEFLFLTGCRPEDALALTWGDIKSDKITFNKAYSNGVLKGTKTDTARTFPVNKQLRELLENRKKKERAFFGDGHLVFPAFKGDYLDLGNFTTRHWQKVVGNLVGERKVSKYLPLYNVRHTFISLMLRNGMDMQTVAYLCGTSVQMLQKHYWSPDQSVQIPEI